MVQAGVGGLDTPRTNIGDETWLERPDIDFSQEQSFISPSKDNNNLVSQLRNGGRRGAINLKTPRSRAVLNDRRNLPAGLGGGEFTPLLKSATRNSALRNGHGKENVPATPAFLKPGGLDKISEDMTPLPVGSSVYGGSRNGSYMAGTPMPEIESSSAASTPMALLPRRSESAGVLQDGNQLSLREQENVISRIEKENFGLKLKIHFLEDALKKSGPGFSEAALKENTDLKVDRITMQKELHRYRKFVASAESDVELYRQQFLEMQNKVKRKHMDQGVREELDRVRVTLEEREAELERLKSQESQVDDLQDKIDDLKTDLREKDREANDFEDEIDNLKEDLEKRDNTISELKAAMGEAQRRAAELEEKAQELDEANEKIKELEHTVKEFKHETRETIQDLERDLQRCQEQAENAIEDKAEAIEGKRLAEEKLKQAVQEKKDAEENLEELQEDIANKSMTSKGFSRQVQEKTRRLQDDLEELREIHAKLEHDHADKTREAKKLQEKIEDFKQDAEVKEQKLKDKLESVQNENISTVRERDSLSKRVESLQNEVHQKSDEKNLLQIRHDALTTESAGLQRDLARLQKTIKDLEEKLDHEKTLALDNERQVRDSYKSELDRLNDENENLQAAMKDRETLYRESDKGWSRELEKLQSQKDMVEDRAANLQRTIDRLQEAEGNLSTKESKLQQALESEKERHQSQEAVLNRQISELNDDLQTRRQEFDEVRVELQNVKEELRLSQREHRFLSEKVEGLEDEVEILQTSLDDESEQANQEIAAARQESDNLRRQIQTLKQDLANAESVAAGARSEMEAFKGDLQAGKGSKEQLSSRLREVEAQLAGVRQEKQILQDQLGKLNLEIHTLRGSKADAEAERDELKSQVRSMQRQEEETFRLDQERVDLRTSKMKLDAEVRRLREENKLALAQQQAVEKELQQEIDRFNAEETRLSSEIHDLQRILRGSSEKRELASAKKTIQNLEARIHELEAQVASGDNQNDAANELSIIRHDLSAARQKETEFLQREAAQKDVLRGLKRQLTELERKAHEAEVSRFVQNSPQSSVSGSARKSELMEVRSQLASAHQTIKEIRAQLKASDKDAGQKINALSIEIQAKATAWEAEKDEFERALDEAEFAREELAAKNSTAEATITRLRGKIERLEKALQQERLNSNEDQTIVNERRDLHEMLRETQLQAESLEIDVQQRDEKIAAITSAERDLRAQLKRVREERAQHQSKAAAAQEQLQNLERKHRKAKENWLQEKDIWDQEKKVLTKGVRFVNTSLSTNPADEAVLENMQKTFEQKERLHQKVVRGLSMQLDYAKAKCAREEAFREEAAYAKRYMALQIALFEACNLADIRALESAGVKRPAPRPKKPLTLRKVAIMVRATIRMQKGAEEWAVSRALNDRIVAKQKQQKKEEAVQKHRDLRARKEREQERGWGSSSQRDREEQRGEQRDRSGSTSGERTGSTIAERERERTGSTAAGGDRATRSNMGSVRGGARNY
ncbi:uncharacterized protein L3040_003736 [Drepanopeziza brunnea f. sp. 'multigermtubi']|uniref:uncharacterized protein n=1 Tax=Drepanopeziza brunnea f. sp. 'multigermtubi' TaxID=698441 RepID=UPI00238F59F4|nr:hypothetical protein L3040_003736 [Drepanopeziza brunnea f. sp. 'multigermtubi']